MVIPVLVPQIAIRKLMRQLPSKTEGADKLCNFLMKPSLPGQTVYTHFVWLCQSCLENWGEERKRVTFHSQIRPTI